MPKSMDDERQKALDRLTGAENNGESKCCNWCGADNEQLEKERKALISDVSHTIYRCADCGELTATYYWSGVVWRAAAETPDGSYTAVAGRSS